MGDATVGNLKKTKGKKKGLLTRCPQSLFLRTHMNASQKLKFFLGEGDTTEEIDAASTRGKCEKMGRSKKGLCGRRGLLKTDYEKSDVVQLEFGGVCVFV